jgi:hypothetical protein
MIRMSGFIADRRGGVAVIAGLAAVPMLLAAGAAVDYTRANNVRATMQNVADATALQMVAEHHRGRDPDYQTIFNAQFAPSTAVSGLTIDGSWLVAGKTFRVTASGTIDTTVMGLIQPTVEVGVVAAAELVQDNVEIELERASLDPEAGDYNEMWAYCYDPVNKERLGPIDPKTGKRTDFVKVADNSDEGIKKEMKPMKIVCGSGENMSLQLHNIRDSRTNVKARKTNAKYDYYTDTTVNGGVVTFNTNPKDLIESILCKTAAQCKPKSEGGILPNNHQTERTPAVHDKACVPGEYLYIGWEDRPPNIGEWTDRDYDDIRVILKCAGTLSGDVVVRLVQ